MAQNSTFTLEAILGTKNGHSKTSDPLEASIGIQICESGPGARTLREALKVAGPAAQEARWEPAERCPQLR